ncbi:MAG: FecR domain-containing protein [Prevotella sp.]|nr:FecR domain-containing protein [Prevotella sp.]
MQLHEFDKLKELMVQGEIDAEELRQRYDIASSIDDERAMQQLKEKCLGNESDNAQEEIQEREYRLQSTHNRRLPLYAIAAAVALFIVGGLFWYRQYTAVTPPVLSQETLKAMQMSKESGHTEGISPMPLTAALHPQKSEESDAEASHEAWIDDAIEIIQHPANKAAMSVDTRNGKEYWLTLSDGTVVHLNNGTRVIYPEHFVGESRDVILDGEAYFMVAKDRRHPFVVHTLAGEVKVYGTEFNVSAHQQKTEVVLVNGSVSVTLGATSFERMLQPGQMATFGAQGTIYVEDVDVEPYVAWNTGTFVFDNIPMQQLMDVLSKWYGFEVVFLSSDAWEKHFTGEIDRYGSIKPTLEAISQVTGLSLRVSDGKIIIE